MGAEGGCYGRGVVGASGRSAVGSGTKQAGRAHIAQASSTHALLRFAVPQGTLHHSPPLASLKSATGRTLKAMTSWLLPKEEMWPCTRTYFPGCHSARRCRSVSLSAWGAGVGGSRADGVQVRMEGGGRCVAEGMARRGRAPQHGKLQGRSWQGRSIPAGRAPPTVVADPDLDRRLAGAVVNGEPKGEPALVGLKHLAHKGDLQRGTTWMDGWEERVPRVERRRRGEVGLLVLAPRPLPIRKQLQAGSNMRRHSSSSRQQEASRW